MLPPTDFKQAITQMDATTYQALRTAVELGKWPDGRALTQDQRNVCLQAVIAYEQQHNVPVEERTGYIDRTGFGAHPPKTDKCHSHHQE
jgi:uncharacterized protein YeaC (DUF1315 family)